MERHSWKADQAWGHGSGDGTPAGVSGGDTCRRCGMVREWDTAVSDYRGIPRPKRWYYDPHSDERGPRREMPACYGYLA